MALFTIKGLGVATIGRLIQHFGSPEAVLHASKTEVMGLPWLNLPQKRGLLRGPDHAYLKACIKAIENMGAWVLGRGSADYPELLGTIPNAPLLLFGLGDAANLAGPAVAIVGSRKATRYGQDVAKKIASCLAGLGVTVVSGMAIGIDTFAHKGAIEAGGRTIAVLGSGLDVPYPRRNRYLMEEIARSGAVISEFLPGTPPEPGHFPQRNRIISGLCLGVVVVEAGERSGSLITASMALEQGREVMAVPGSVRSGQSRGTHWLIKQGAWLVENGEDVLAVLGLDVSSPKKADSGSCRVKDHDSWKEVTPEKARVLDAIGPYPVHIDEISERTGIGPGLVGAILLELELDGLVQALPGKYYQSGER